MVEYKKRAGLAQLAAVLGVLGGGVVAGFLFGRVVAPDSQASAFVSAIMLPVAVFAGVTLWLGGAIVFVVANVVKAAVSDRPAATAAVRERYALPPGSVAFVPASVVCALVAAFLVSTLSTEATLFRTSALYLLVGLAHGLVAWRLARSGYFPAPDGT